MKLLWEGKPDKSGYVLSRWPVACMGLIIIIFTFFWLYLITLMPKHELHESGFGRYIYPLLPYFSIAGVSFGSWLFFRIFVWRIWVWRTVRYSVTDSMLIIQENQRTIEISYGDIFEIIIIHSLMKQSNNIGTICIKCSAADKLPIGMNILITIKSIPIARAFVAISNVDDVGRIIFSAINKYKMGSTHEY